MAHRFLLYSLQTFPATNLSTGLRQGQAGVCTSVEGLDLFTTDESFAMLQHLDPKL